MTTSANIFAPHAQTILARRYLAKDEQGRVVETAEEMLMRVAAAVADIIRAEARETDRASRIGAPSFRVLLPETGARAARSVAARLDRAFGASLGGQAGGIAVCTEVATAPRNGSLEDALAEAEQRLATRATGDQD